MVSARREIRIAYPSSGASPILGEVSHARARKLLFTLSLMNLAAMMLQEHKELLERAMVASFGENYSIVTL